MAAALVTADLAVATASPADGEYHEHTETAQYTIDISYPLGYPDMGVVADFVAADRADFVDWVAYSRPDDRGRRYAYAVDGKTFRSTQPAVTSLVLTIDDDTGAAHQGHPATSFHSFGYDLKKRAPVTFDTLLRPEALPVITAYVRRAYNAPALELRPSDCRDFAVTDDVVVFFFGEGQLIPADNTGPRQISVPRGELAPLIA